MATATTARTNKHKKATGDVKHNDVAASANKSNSPVKPFMPNNKKTNAELVAEHLPPLSLIFVVLVCSGGLFVLSLRDALATGKIIAGPMDEAMQVCQKRKISDDGIVCFLCFYAIHFFIVSFICFYVT